MTTTLPLPVASPEARVPFPEALEGNKVRVVGFESLSRRAAADYVHLVAHGSPDPRHAASVRRLAARVSELTGTAVTASFLDHNTPRAGAALLSPIRATLFPARRRVAVLPLLLTAGVHWHRDIPPVVGHQGDHHRLLPPLAPDAFAVAVSDLVPLDASAVVLASAGSTRPQAAQRFAALGQQVEALLADLGRDPAVRVALSPADIAGAVVPGATVVPVLVADGVFADQIRAAAAAAGARATEVVGDTWPGAHAVAAAVG